MAVTVFGSFTVQSELDEARERARDAHLRTTQSGQRLNIQIDNYNERNLARDLLRRAGAFEIGATDEDHGMPDYHEASLRSGLDPQRLTDI